MKIVQKYGTDDGQLFDTTEEARDHERRWKLTMKLTAIMRPAINSGRSDAVITSMVANAVAVRDALSDFIKRQPKQNKAQSVLDEQ